MGGAAGSATVRGDAGLNAVWDVIAALRGGGLRLSVLAVVHLAP